MGYSICTGDSDEVLYVIVYLLIINKNIIYINDFLMRIFKLERDSCECKFCFTLISQAFSGERFLIYIRDVCLTLLKKVSSGSGSLYITEVYLTLLR